MEHIDLEGGERAGLDGRGSVQNGRTRMTVASRSIRDCGILGLSWEQAGQESLGNYLLQTRSLSMLSLNPYQFLRISSGKIPHCGQWFIKANSIALIILY